MTPPFEQERDSFNGSLLAEKYKIIKRVASGGMGSVYQGLHVLMDRRVAIKTVHARYAQSDPSCLSRFQLEAKAASCLSHPNIMAVFDFGISNEGIAYLVMDYIDGDGLDVILKREHALTATRAVHIFSQACDALSHAHEQGIVHRDLKPSNIMLIRKSDGSETIKIVDFGIAKILPGRSHSLQFTQNKAEVIGSPLYMSPEQCLGKQEQDGRSDIYSLGCLMYEALTGQAPIRERSVLGIMYKHINELPRHFDVAAPGMKIPPALEAVIFTALAKNPDDRYQTMADLRLALEASIAGDPKSPHLQGTIFANPTFNDRSLNTAPSNPDLFPYLIELSELYLAQGQSQKAEEHLRKAVAHLAESHGAWDSRIAEPLKKLAELYRDNNRLDDAEPLYFDLLAIKRKSVGTVHPDIACILLGLSEVLFATGKYDSAKRYYRQCAKITADLLGSESSALIPAYTGMAICLRRLGQFDEAEKLLLQTLHLKEITYGADDYDLASTLYGLGVVQRFKGNLPDAERSLLRALEIYENTRGPEHTEVASLLLALAEIYSVQKMDAAAEELYSRAVSICETELSATDPTIADAYESWASHHLRRLNFADAESVYRKVLSLKEKSFGEFSPELAPVLHYLAEICLAQEKFDSADEFFQRAKSCEVDTVITN